MVRNIGQGGIQPEEIDLLQRVFDHLCVDANCDKDSEDAEYIGITLFQIYQGGARNEADLLAQARDRRKDFLKRSA